MNKNEVKLILISMRTPENEARVNYILGKIDIMDENAFLSALKQVGNTEDGVKKLFEEKLSQIQDNGEEEKSPINDMFTYGITGNCVHLHLPGNLQGLIEEKGMSRAIETVNLSLLDAINKVVKLKSDGYYKLKDVDSIYMISPILIEREMRFLREMNFQTHSYKKRELRDPEFLEEHSEAQLATHIFGSDSNVGTALIKIDTILSNEWQEKRKQKIKEFADKGIVLEDNSKIEVLQNS